MKTLSKVLVIDDDDDILKITQFCFELMPSIELKCVKSGEEGIKEALNGSFDLILLDVMMPEMDGIATFKAFRLMPKFAKTPIIFLTAKSQKNEIEEYFEMGVDNVIIKPFDPLTFPASVAATWERFQNDLEGQKS